MIPRKLFRLIFSVLCVSSIAQAEERLGLLGISDGTLTNRTSSIPYGLSSSQTNLNGGFILLGSLRLKENLFAFYEGRVNHSEGLGGSFPRLQRTETHSVVQGYLRYSPRLAWDLNVQIGKFGTPFGHFLTRNYSNENPLIGSPLIYTHRTPISAKGIPRNPVELLSYRGRGQGYGSYLWGNGGAWLPLINFSYPTGIMAFGNPGKLDYRVALVNSSLANPINLGTPGQRAQWVAAAGCTCLPGLHIGTSYTEGPYLASSVSRWLPTGISSNDFKQRAFGFDLQYAIDHLEIYGELLFNNFAVPYIPQRLGATGYFIELKQTWTPRIFSAVRWNQIFFDRLRSGLSDGSHPRFDYNVNSLEAGIGFRFSEKLLAKFSYQYNRTMDEMEPREDVFGVQLVYTFDIRNLLRIR
jgi:hypothetical protein